MVSFSPPCRLPPAFLIPYRFVSRDKKVNVIIVRFVFYHDVNFLLCHFFLLSLRGIFYCSFSSKAFITSSVVHSNKSLMRLTCSGDGLPCFIYQFLTVGWETPNALAIVAKFQRLLFSKALKFIFHLLLP